MQKVDRKMELVKQFHSVINRKYLTDDVFNALVHSFYLDKYDLEKEWEKINQKNSGLSRRERQAVEELLILKKMLEEKKLEESKVQDMSANASGSDIAADQITFGTIPAGMPTEVEPETETVSEISEEIPAPAEEATPVEEVSAE